MDRYQWWIGVGLSLCVCTAAVVQGLNASSHFANQDGANRGTVDELGPIIARPTPAQEAEDKHQWDLYQAAKTALDAGDYAAAEDYAKRCIVLRPLDGLSLFAEEPLAAALNAQGKTQEAMQAYKVMADAGGGQSRTLVPYAVLLFHSGQYAQAVRIYNRALPVLPFSIESPGHAFSPDVPQLEEFTTALYIAQGLNDLGNGVRSSSFNVKALDELEEALRRAPDSPSVNYYYGLCWQQMDAQNRAALLRKRPGLREKARAALQKAASLGTGHMQTVAQIELQGLH